MIVSIIRGLGGEIFPVRAFLINYFAHIPVEIQMNECENVLHLIQLPLNG